MASCENCCPPPPCPPPPCCCSPPPPPQTQTISMRPGCPEKNSPPFNFQTSTNTDSGAGVCVVPPSCTAKDGTKITEISDPGREMFVLRIGKKSEGGSNEKNRVDLELSTPRPVYVPPPPEMEHRKCQYDPNDFGGLTEGKKEKGEAKGGKDKKKKK